MLVAGLQLSQSLRAVQYLPMPLRSVSTRASRGTPPILPWDYHGHVQVIGKDTILIWCTKIRGQGNWMLPAVHPLDYARRVIALKFDAWRGYCRAMDRTSKVFL